jgi:hypothetical protein
VSNVSIEQVDISVEDWIDGVTFTQVKVELHRNPALYAELKPMYDRIEAAEADLAELVAREERPAEQAADTLLGEEAPPAPVTDELLSAESAPSPTRAAAEEHLESLYAAAEELYARYDADKEVWTLRALLREEIQALTADVEQPEAPKPVAPKAPKATRERYAKRVAEHIEALKVFATEVNVRCVQAAVVSVVVAGVEHPKPSLDGMRKIATDPARRYGRHLEQLKEALEAISLQEVAVAAPKSLRPSKDDQG